eukprot:TRINITY_DN961_c0_g1_i1.p1 TRINITY_DN961_c0_g1~~TRINITY_DN961_c0_g1_i1.p1  ORF type:complete len:364 (-),score=61.88 TRINITY_DN961_c0_g1_i1:1719-2810(-)
MTTATPKVRVVEVPFKKLQGDELLPEIERAMGPDSMGIIAVSQIEGFPELRKRQLFLIDKYARLPENVKNKYVQPENEYTIGWSHGKEKLENGKFDTMKGSFYANPMEKAKGSADDYSQVSKDTASFSTRNVWPSELEEMETVFMELGQLMAKVGHALMRHCELYVCSKNPEVPVGHLVGILERCNGRSYKGRLLHYFPLDGDLSNAASISSWCGRHVDFGSITALTRAMYMNSEGLEVSCPDERAGLYIWTRSGKIVQAVLSETSLAFQVGMALQMHSGGLLQATPHCVKAAECPEARGIARNTFALFMQPLWDEPMVTPPGCANPSEVHKSLAAAYPNAGLSFNPTITFGEMGKKILENGH